jgi:opacity protein-like surface antigen
MSRRLLLLLAAGLVAFLPLSVAAESHESGHRGAPNFELYGGYSYLVNAYNPTSNRYSVNGMNGWDASMKVPIFGPFLGIKGDVSGFYRDASPQFHPRTYLLLVGPQVGFHIWKSTLFAHGMVGSATVSNSAPPKFKSDSSLALAIGAGLDIGFTRRLAWRLTGDYCITHFQGAYPLLNQIQIVNQITNSNGRISTGPVFRF